MSLHNYQDPAFRPSQQWNQRDNQFDLVQEEKVLETPLMESKKQDTNVDSMELSQETLPQPLVEIVAINKEEQGISGDNTYKSLPIIDIKTPENLSFSQWLLQLEGTKKNSEETIIINSKNKSTKRELKSVEDETTESNAYSETLAALLATQGYKEEAISMYEKLKVRFPQKRAIFAALIQELKK
ncbi:MAG: hypothetical protein IT267_01270 [Saprospiraceae bacterium]|nr:hypothetical protein [Saprospiraceae bacterium]